jgi:hypothetical protein
MSSDYAFKEVMSNFRQKAMGDLESLLKCVAPTSGDYPEKMTA